MAKARSVVDVILGEAASGTKSERYKDMLAIASVIANRAAQLGVTPEEVVGDSRSFNAFGKDLPPGVEKFRELAQQALQEVKTAGPVTNATFYATPGTVGNLPKGLEFTYQTKGHRYAYDPQGRSIRTASGFRKPQEDRDSALLPTQGPIPTFRPGGLLGEPDATGGLLAFNEPGRDQNGGVNAINRAMAGPAPSANDILSYSNSGAIRNQPVTENLSGRLTEAVRSVYGPGYSAQVYSGGQPHKGEGGRRTGSVRHDGGRAADVYIVDPSGNRVTGDRLAPLGQYWAAKGYGGVGMEMKGGGIHLDEWSTPPPGGGMYWNYADKGGRYTPTMAKAMEAGVAGQLPALAPMTPDLPAGSQRIAGTPPQTGTEPNYPGAGPMTPELGMAADYYLSVPVAENQPLRDAQQITPPQLTPPPQPAAPVRPPQQQQRVQPGQRIPGWAGTVAGGLFGGLLGGPVGGMVGGLLGRRLANKGVGGLLGDDWEMPGSGWRRTRQANNQAPWGGGSPDGRSPAEQQRMSESLSDRAREAASRGPGGLY